MQLLKLAWQATYVSVRPFRRAYRHRVAAPQLRLDPTQRPYPVLRRRHITTPSVCQHTHFGTRSRCANPRSTTRAHKRVRVGRLIAPLGSKVDTLFTRRPPAVVHASKSSTAARATGAGAAYCVPAGAGCVCGRRGAGASTRHGSAGRGARRGGAGHSGGLTGRWDGCRQCRGLGGGRRRRLRRRRRCRI